MRAPLDQPLDHIIVAVAPLLYDLSLRYGFSHLARTPYDAPDKTIGELPDLSEIGGDGRYLFSVDRGPGGGERAYAGLAFCVDGGMVRVIVPDADAWTGMPLRVSEEAARVAQEWLDAH